MALTVEILQKNEALKDLTAEQFTVIAALSATDENSALGSKIGEIHGAYEQDILSITGIAKTNGEKAYDYNKRVLSKYKAELEDNLKTVKSLTEAKEALETQLKNKSTDEALKQQVDTLNKQLKDAQDAITAKDKLISDTEAKYKADIHKAKVDFVFSKADAGLAIKSGFTESIAKTILAQAKNELLTKFDTEFAVDALGNETLVFRDKESKEIVRNPDNAQNPYTAAELYMTTAVKDIIDPGRSQKGGGTGPNNKLQDYSMLDLSGVKTQDEADSIIYNHLMEKGLTRGSAEFAAEQAKLRTENEIANLPIR